MVRVWALLLGVALLSGPLSAQQSDDAARSQFAIDAGVLTAGLSFAQRLGTSAFSLGVGVWGGWEPPATVEHQVLEPIGGVLFVRYQPSTWLVADLGPAIYRYATADDCSTCSATFIGARSSLLVGYRFIFVGPEVSTGSFRRDGESELGVMYGAQVRIMLGWGR